MMLKAITAIVMGLILTASGWSHEVAGVRVPDVIFVQGGMDVPLYGAGLLRYKAIFKGYALALYLPRRTRDPLANVPKQLTFHYFWDIKADAFGKASTDIIKRNVTAVEFEVLKPKIDEFHKLYVDIKKGDRYHLRYKPNAGTQLMHNDKLLGTVKGRDFARAYFSIWLGKRPIDNGLKKAITTKILMRR